MKKFTIVILCLALAGLACLEPAAGIDPGHVVFTETVKVINTVPIMATRIEIGQTLTNAPKLCARVAAETAEHLRRAPSVNGGSILHMRAGDVVRVIDQRDADWWLVEAGSYVGFARSRFLQLEECAQ